MPSSGAATPQEEEFGQSANVPNLTPEQKDALNKVISTGIATIKNAANQNTIQQLLAIYQNLTQGTLVLSDEDIKLFHQFENAILDNLSYLSGTEKIHY